MDARYPSLEGRSVFITGGGSGIGAAIVRQFCAQRARVAFVARFLRRRPREPRTPSTERHVTSGS